MTNQGHGPGKKKSHFLWKETFLVKLSHCSLFQLLYKKKKRGDSEGKEETK